MKILIFGATGGIGKYALKYALSKDYDVTAYVRNAKKIQEKSDKLTIIENDITNKTAIEEALKGQDAVLWCIGVPLKRSYDNMDSLDGHKILIPAMEKMNVKRLIDWGTPSISFEEDKASMVTSIPKILASILYPMAKKEMIAIGNTITKSNLDWTIVRFIAPNNKDYKGNVKVSFGDKRINFFISRQEIAKFMIDELKNNNYIKSMPIIGT